MPKERAIHGKIMVIEAANATDVEDVYGNKVGAKAHMMHEYVPGESHDLGDVIEEGMSVDFNWSKMTDEPGNGYAQVSVSIPINRAREVLDLATDRGEDYFTFFSDMLSRADLNRLIRLTRHVRNSAHGVDE